MIASEESRQTVRARIESHHALRPIDENALPVDVCPHVLSPFCWIRRGEVIRDATPEEGRPPDARAAGVQKSGASGKSRVQADRKEHVVLIPFLAR